MSAEAVRVTSAWVVRPAQPDELDAVGDLTVRSYVAGSGLGPDDEYVRVLRDAESRYRAGEVLVVPDPEGRIVGTVTICPLGTAFAEVGHPGELEFRFLAVAPEAWGAGVAEALVSTLAERAAGPLVCVVIDDNEPAHRFYRRLGFRRLPERDFAPRPDVQLLAYSRP